MLGELRRELGLQSQLSEAVQNAPFGTVVGWRTPAGKAYGVVVGKEGKELLCLSAFSKSLAKDKSLTYYEDKSASGKLQQAMPGVLMALQRVPMNRAFKRGRVEGTGLQPYLKAAAHLQLESGEENDMEFEKLNERLDEINESLQEMGMKDNPRKVVGEMVPFIQGQLDRLKKAQDMTEVRSALNQVVRGANKALHAMGN